MATRARISCDHCGKRARWTIEAPDGQTFGRYCRRHVKVALAGFNDAIERDWIAGERRLGMTMVAAGNAARARARRRGREDGLS